MCPRHHLSFCACTTAWLAPEIYVSMGRSPYLWFLHAKQRLLEQNYKSLWVPGLTCRLWMQNRDFWTRITNLYWSQIWFVVLCMQNIVISTRLLVSMGPSPDLRFCTFKRATLGPELLVSMGPRPRQWFCACKTLCLASELLVSMCPSPHLRFCAFNRATLGQELHVSRGPRPHLAFCACNTAWLATDLLVSMGPSRYLWFCIQNSDFWTGITSLYGSQI